MDYKGMFKVDFREARENAGLDISIVEKIARGVGHDIDLYGIEAKRVKPTENEINLLMSIYGKDRENNGFRL